MIRLGWYGMIEKEWAALARVFGSESRLMTLATLANASAPISGYRIAKVGRISPPKVYSELRRLKNSDIVARQQSDSGRSGWILKDTALGQYLRLRVRISDSPDWFKESERRSNAALQWLRSVDTSTIRQGTRADPLGIPNSKEFVRSRSKDRDLRRVGLRVSRRPRAG
jgi:DNA-binding transcriptional ArsR family regulator